VSHKFFFEAFHRIQKQKGPESQSNRRAHFVSLQHPEFGFHFTIIVWGLQDMREKTERKIL
jgi:hypothetical protein